MKNKIKSIVSAMVVLVLVAPVLAMASGDALVIDPGNTGLASTSLYDLAMTAMKWLLGAVGLFSIIAFAISGVLYLTAAGDDDRIKQAKLVMTTAITGIVVAMIGLIAVSAVNAFLFAGSSNNGL